MITLLICMAMAFTLAEKPFLCEAQQTDKVQIQCKTDVGTFATSIPASTDQLSIVSFNLDRNGAGEDVKQVHRLQNIINVLKNDTTEEIGQLPDVILLQEVARDCWRYGRYQDGIKEMAESLGMYYVYAVEYMDLEHFKSGGLLDGH